jgi:hypothetical protein
MRMSGLSKVEMFAFIGGRGRYGNGANRLEPTRTGPATCAARDKAEAHHVERLLSFLPGSPTSQCAAPVYNTHTHSAGESWRVNSKAGLHEEIDFCSTTAGTSPFLTRAPQNHDSRISPTLSLRPEQHSKVASVAAKEEYSGLRKSQWHKGGVELHEADSTDQQHAILAI